MALASVSDSTDIGYHSGDSDCKEEITLDW